MVVERLFASENSVSPFWTVYFFRRLLPSVCAPAAGTRIFRPAKRGSWIFMLFSVKRAARSVSCFCAIFCSVSPRTTVYAAVFILPSAPAAPAAGTRIFRPAKRGSWIFILFSVKRAARSVSCFCAIFCIVSPRTTVYAAVFILPSAPAAPAAFLGCFASRLSPASSPPLSATAFDPAK